MNEQRTGPQVRIADANDRDLRDAKTSLSLIKRLTEQSHLSQNFHFNAEELQTLIRNCTHAIILNLTKTIEKPNERVKEGAYNLESLIDYVCHDEDKDTLKQECHKIRGDKIYSKLVEYRLKIIAHRNIRYSGYQAMEQEFTECKDYLLQNKGHIEKLVEKINALQMKIKRSRTKKEFGYEGEAEIIRVEISPEDIGEKKEITYFTKY